MQFGASFYLRQMIAPDVVLSFSAVMGDALNALSVVDAHLRTRNSKLGSAKIKEWLIADPPFRQLLLFQRSKGGSQNFPERHLALTRLPAKPEEDEIFSLAVSAPDDDAARRGSRCRRSVRPRRRT